MKKVTIRFSNLAHKRLINLQFLFKLHGSKFSLNQLVNLLVFSNSPRARLSKKDIEKIKHIHSGIEYQNCANELANLTNNLNVFLRQIKGVSTNINQISKVINENQKTFSNSQFIALINQLQYYMIIIHKCLAYLDKLNKEVAKLWAM